MTLHTQMVPEEVQALQRELRNHPELWNSLKASSKTFEDIIAGVADHLDIVLHGDYAVQDIQKLCQILVQKLQDKRKVIITDPAKIIDLMPDPNHKPFIH